MEAAAGTSLARDDSSVLMPVVLGTALIAQLAACRMSSNWEYRLPSSSPATQPGQGRSRQQHGRGRLRGRAANCFQHLHAEAQPHSEKLGACGFPCCWTVAPHRLPKGRARNNKGGWGRAVARLHPNVCPVGLELASLTAATRKPRWSSTVLSALADRAQLLHREGGEESTGRRKKQDGDGRRAQARPHQWFAVLRPTGRTTASLETTQDRS